MATEVSPQGRAQSPAYIHVERCWPAVDKLSPCEAACPLNMDVPGYVIAIARGEFRQALDIARQTNPLPSVCGRVCHHPCEAECNRKAVDTPVAIQWLKRAAVDFATHQRPSPAPRTRKERVAIVGSGPAGLTAAHDLVRAGYGATVFEAAATPGGILTSAIPDFILGREAALADVDYIKALGVRIHTGVRIGTDLSLEGLRRQGYEAVLVAAGMQKAAQLKIPGADLPGVFLALPWLREAKAGRLHALAGKVWVIGGGAVAMDAARTALRLGAGEVHVACLECRADMPAFAWEIEAAEKEGVRLHPSLAPQQFVARDVSTIGQIDFKRVASTRLDSEGRVQWTLLEGPGSDYPVAADTVIVAIGQAADLAGLDGLSFRKGSMQTDQPGVFAAGDICGSGGTVAQAMAAGRRVAVAIDRYLRGQPAVEAHDTRGVVRVEPEQVPAFFPRKERWEMPRLRPGQAVRSFCEVELGYRDWQAVEEAGRCLNCRMCANCVFERTQVCFETARRLL